MSVCVFGVFVCVCVCVCVGVDVGVFWGGSFISQLFVFYHFVRNYYY